ncbi:MAG: hypothetical protein R3F56_20500 [Planctomycetota bacterium]
MASSTTKKKVGPAPAPTNTPKNVKKPAAAKSPVGSLRKRSKTPAKSDKRTGMPLQPATVARAMMAFDDDDVLPSGGSGAGVGYGRCGGRMLSSRVERLLCDLLSREGVAHSHHPRHFEVRLEDESVAAYAPMIVVRGRGREGKTVVIEALDAVEPGLLDKVRAFRRSYGLEFYVSFVGSEELLDEIPLDVYDEATDVQNAVALVSRLAD